MPTLVVVTGNPGVGKSTLAAELGEVLGFPVFRKDDLKERLYDVLGWSTRAWSQRLGHASTLLLYDIVERELAARRSVIVESNFPPEHSSAPLRAAAERWEASVVQVVLSCPPEIASARFAARTRHPGHVLKKIPKLPPLAPLDLPGICLEIDSTTFPLDVTPIVAAVNGAP